MPSITAFPPIARPADCRIAAAAVVRLGRHGDGTRLAHNRGVQRQTLYREAHPVLRALEPAGEDPRLRQLRQQVATRHAEVAALRQQLRQAVRIDEGKQAQFASTAPACGVSLRAARARLQVFLGDRAPSVPTGGRLTRAAGPKAPAQLAVLDTFSRARARQVAADEIDAGRRPVLMTGAQESLCWLGGRLAPSRDRAEGAQEFRPLPAVEQVTRDAGVGLQKGLEVVNAQRRQSGQPAVLDPDDHFHVRHWARRGGRAVRRKAVRALAQAEPAPQAVDRVRRQGRAVGGLGRAAPDRWQKAEAAWDRWAADEQAFARLRVALRLVSPDGQLNTRARAEAAVRQALAQLTGPAWWRLHRRLKQAKLFPFLDRVQEQVAALPAPAALVRAAVRVEGLRRQPERLQGEGPAAAALRGVLLAAGLALSLVGESGSQVLALVRGCWAGRGVRAAGWRG